MDWIQHNTYLSKTYTNLTCVASNIKFACFDLDDTLIIGKKYPATFTTENVEDKLFELLRRKYMIIIFTNQSGMSGKKFDHSRWRKDKDMLIENFIGKKNIKYMIKIYVAMDHDIYRKPNPTLWNVMLNDIASEFKLDKIRVSNKSFYCGDACGRLHPSFLKTKIHPSSKVGDFSDVDIKFANNITPRLQFYSPDEYFLGIEDQHNLRISGFNPCDYFYDIINNGCFLYDNFIPCPKKEVIIMVGRPASGKSSYVKQFILPNNYEIISTDLDKSLQSSLKKMENLLSSKKSIIVDNTNPDMEKRKIYIEMAKKYNYKNIRCININTSHEISYHLNNVRNIYSNNKIKKINKIVYHIYNKKYQQPALSEGFSKIENVNFYLDEILASNILWLNAFLLYSEN